MLQKVRKYKGLWIFLLAAVLCYTLLGRADLDIFWVDYDGDSFYTRYLPGFAPEATDPLAYVSEQEGAVRAHTLRKGALSLKAGEYDLGLSYSDADDATFLKVFSSDYTAADNTGGKVLLYQPLDPQQTYCKATFTLDQDVGSLYVLVETRAPDFAVNYLHMASFARSCTDMFFYCALTLLCALVLFWLRNARFARVAPGTLGQRTVQPRRVVWCCVLVGTAAVVVVSLPLLQSGLLHGHDLPYHLARIEGLASGLASGQFPVRVHGETLNGFCYPNSYFYPELLFYFPAALSLLGVHTITCYKAYLILVHLLTLVLSYLPFKRLLHSRRLALALAVVYLANPYRLICAYYRAAVGEFAAMTFLPLVLYGLYAILLGDQRDWPCLVAGASGLLQSHILTTELAALLCGVLLLLFIRQLFTREKRFYSLLAAGVYTVLLNAWFILPMLAMSISTHPAVYTRTQSPFGYTLYDIQHLFAVVSLNDIGPHMVGWVPLLAVACYLLHRLALPTEDAAPEAVAKQATASGVDAPAPTPATLEGVVPVSRAKNTLRFADTLAVVCVGGAFATTAYFPWDRVAQIPLVGRLLDVIQFPYRLMSLVGLCAAALAGYAVLLWLRKREHQSVACAVMTALSLLFASLLCEVAFLNADAYPGKHYYNNNMNNSLCVGQYEYLPSGATIEDIVDTAPTIQSGNASLAVSDWRRAGTNMSFSYQMKLDPAGDNTIVLPLTYLPKYEVRVDGQKVEVLRTDTARVAFAAPAAQGSVTVRYREPWIFRLCEVASLLSLAALLCRRRLAAALRKKRRRA